MRVGEEKQGNNDIFLGKGDLRLGQRCLPIRQMGCDLLWLNIMSSIPVESMKEA